MSFLDFLAPYLSQMGGGGIMSPGQPTYGGADNDMTRDIPGAAYMPEIRSTPADLAGSEGSYQPLPQHGGVDPSTGRMPDPASGWKQYLPGILGLAGSAIGGHFAGGGNGLAAAAGFASNYANAKHADIQRRRAEQFETEKAVGDTAHKMWQELQGADLSKLPPNLSHLAQQKAEFDQKYAMAIAKDGISPKEAQELISLGSVIKSALPEVQQFSQHAKQAEPYTQAISSGAMEPPPGAESIAEMGLPDEEQSRLAGIESFQGAELARQQYDTPQQSEYGLMTARDALQQRANDARAKQAAATAAATEVDRRRRDDDRDAHLGALVAHWNTSGSGGDKPIKVSRRNPDTGHNEIVLVHPRTGDLVATIGDSPLGATSTNRAESADAVLRTAEDIKSNLADPAFVAQLGPAMGRFNTLRDFIGNPPPEYAQLAGEIESFALANMGVHGMRSVIGANQISALLNQKHTPESLIAAINGLTHFSHNFLQTVGREKGGAPPPSLTQPPTLPGAGGSPAPRKYKILKVE